jgi:hypothetical protein
MGKQSQEPPFTIHRQVARGPNGWSTHITAKNCVLTSYMLLTLFGQQRRLDATRLGRSGISLEPRMLPILAMLAKQLALARRALNTLSDRYLETYGARYFDLPAANT